MLSKDCHDCRLSEWCVLGSSIGQVDVPARQKVQGRTSTNSEKGSVQTGEQDNHNSQLGTQGLQKLKHLRTSRGVRPLFMHQQCLQIRIFCTQALEFINKLLCDTL
jgi:hypothetical protein